MTKEEIKKELERGARVTGHSTFVDAYKLIIEQEKEIEQLKAAKNDWKQRYESFETFIASSIECIDKKVKKIKIDMLSKVKARCAETITGKRRISAAHIDKIIEEVETDK